MKNRIQPHRVILLFSICIAVEAAPPRVTNDRYELELVASEPEIVTPVGMTFDAKGRLLVVESHTHERPDGYSGPEKDRIRMLSDSDGDGRLDHWSTFAEGFRHATNLLGRKDGPVYLTERGRLLLLNDTDDDGQADIQQQLLQMETEDDYPHNGFGGIAQEPSGTLLISLGENHGFSYRITAADDTVIADEGGQDGVYRITADGKKLERVAGGMWNPFHICTLQVGRIFAVDNDPDACPPCRLLHVVPGGDYGYLYQYGRAGTHPLQAWNGELPGTLPMVCGTGEAPTAIVPHAGSLWVTSWGDHRIERYRLVPRGASYGAVREVVVQGDADFRPTGMAVAPDGSLYFGDWVLRDYPVHGKGRLWRLELSGDEVAAQFPSKSPDDARSARMAEEDATASNDPFVRAASVWRIAEQKTLEQRGERRMSSSSSALLSGLAAMRLVGSGQTEAILRDALEDVSPDVRLYAVRWIADERIRSLRDDVAKLLEGPQPNSQYYLAVLAALDWLDHEPAMRGKEIADELLVKELENESRSADAHTLAMRLLSPDNKFLSLDRLRGYLKSDHAPLRLEAVRTLAQQAKAKRLAVLADVAADESEDLELRVEAVAGLAGAADAHRELLDKLAECGEPMLEDEANRVLRLAGLKPLPSENKPPSEDLKTWTVLLSEGGDAAAGQRLFFSAVGARCGVCHQHEGRGGRIGPDLTNIGRSNNREQVIASILQPSREIAPHYQPWSLTTNDGKTHTGLRKAQGGDNGIETYIDSTGKEFQLPSDTIEERSVAEKSIMPDGLQETLSIADLRDLIAFLTSNE